MPVYSIIYVHGRPEILKNRRIIDNLTQVVEELNSYSRIVSCVKKNCLSEAMKIIEVMENES